jgi:hypothetical protein
MERNEDRLFLLKGESQLDRWWRHKVLHSTVASTPRGLHFVQDRLVKTICGAGYYLRRKYTSQEGILGQVSGASHDK